MFSSFIVILYSLFHINLCLNDSSILLVPFKTKSLQKEEDLEDYSEPQWSEMDNDYPFVPTPQRYVCNASTFINQWFYNGIYTFSTIGSKLIESYINIEHSKLSIEKCNINRVYSKATFNQKTYYKPLNSETYTKIEKKMGNDIFTFIGDLSYKSTVVLSLNRSENLLKYFF